MTEIGEARQQLELDLRELEDRLPGPLRSVKSLVGVVLGTALMAFLVRRARTKRSDRTPAAEVVIRIVRDDR